MNTQLSVVTVESGTVYNQETNVSTPVIYIFGRTANLEKKTLRLPVQPYFYIYENDYAKLKEQPLFNSLGIIETEGTPSRSLTKYAMMKVYCKDGSKILEHFRGINKNTKYEERSYWAYEADLAQQENLGLRWMIDNQVRSGIEVDEKGNFVKPIEFSVPVRRWYIDFEARSYNQGVSPLNSPDSLNMISIFDTYELTMYTYYVNNEKWAIDMQGKQIFTPFKEFKHVIQSFPNEWEFLDGICKLVQEKNPDKFLAWYGKGYDLPKWKQRCEVNIQKCIYKFRELSPLNSITGYGNRIEIKGRIFWDLKELYKKFTGAELGSYALGYVADTEKLGYKDIPSLLKSFKNELRDKQKEVFAKIPFQGTAGECWDKRPDIIFQRNVLDVLIEYALDCKYGVSDLFENKQHSFGLLPKDVNVPNRIIDTVILRLVKNRFVLRSIDLKSINEVEEGKKLLGAIVAEPKVGEYKYVFQFDFSAEYPSMIQGFNISPETWIQYEKVKDFSKVHHIQYIDPVRGTMNFCFKKDEKGIIPEVIEYFKKLRTEYKKKEEEAIKNKEDEAVIKKWGYSQVNAKVGTNSVYGIMGNRVFRLYNEQCTQATAVLGRITAECEYEFVKTLDVGYGKGYELLYGDTDSFFLKAKSTTKDALYDEGVKLQKALQENLENFFKTKYGITTPTELGFKAIYDWIMFVGKKNYASHMMWDEKKKWIEDFDRGFDIKGVSSVRSDASAIERASVNALLRGIAMGSDNKTMFDYIEKVLKEFDLKEHDIIDISYPAQISKTIQQKKGEWIATGYGSVIPAHIKAVLYSNYFLGTAYETGGKPRRLPVKLPKLKTKAGQETLTKTTKFPSEWDYKGKLVNKKKGTKTIGKVFKVTDIAIVEDMIIPQYFLNSIDYKRIRDRLEMKLRYLLYIRLYPNMDGGEIKKLIKKEIKDRGKTKSHTLGEFM